jgi:hypothetical protein
LPARDATNGNEDAVWLLFCGHRCSCNNLTTAR